MKNGKHIKVLIVDDVVDMVDNLDEIIRHRFPEIKTEHALNAHDAIKKFDAFIPHFVLLDIGLGDNSGLNVLKHIRQTKLHSKVIMVSNYTDAVHQNICAVLGADAFVDKTKEFEKIPEILLRLMEVEVKENAKSIFHSVNDDAVNN